MSTALRKYRLSPSRRGSAAGFTLLELIVVVTMIGILATLALPNLIQMPRRAKESVLKNNLHTIRQTLDQFYGDQGFYPASLEALEEEGYLRSVPMDPFTDEREWGLVYEEPDAGDDFDDFGGGGGGYDYGGDDDFM